MRAITFRGRMLLCESTNHRILFGPPPQVGVTEVILAVNYKPEVMMEALVEMEKKYKVKLTCSVETEPMGTGACLGTAFYRKPQQESNAAVGTARSCIATRGWISSG